METVTSANLQRHLGAYTERALVEPVMITRNGRERIVMISAEEFRRLQSLDRVSLHVSDLSAEEVDGIASAEMPREYEYLNDELK